MVSLRIVPLTRYLDNVSQYSMRLDTRGPISWHPAIDYPNLWLVKSYVVSHHVLFSPKVLQFFWLLPLRCRHGKHP